MIPESREHPQELVAPRREPYPHHLGKAVEILMPGGLHFIGIYRGLTNHDDLVLQPCLSRRWAPTHEAKSTKIESIPYWSNRPSFLCYRQFASIVPLEEADVDHYLSLCAATRDTDEQDYCI